MTTRWLRGAEPTLLHRLAAAERIFCFVDYDGTLAPLAARPEAAVPPAGTAALLRELAATPGLAVALVTGRTIADLRRYLDVPGIYYVGVHGLELGLPNGTVELSKSAAVMRTLIPAIKREVEQVLVSRPGVVLEDKGVALACHYRLASRADAEIARDAVTSIVRRYCRRGARIALLDGHEVIEIRCAWANKGKAVCRLLATHGPPALAVYLGDDRTDEDAFRLLPPDAITIRVGPARGPTAARYRAADPAAVRQFLRAIVACRRGWRHAAAEMPGGYVRHG